jgi:RNA polymerase sigma-70 factor (sigma-E family)
VDRESRRDVLAVLYARHYPELRRAAFALTGDWALAEDLTQEAFVRAWRSWSRLRREESARAYLHVIVVNLARTSLRRQLRELRARAAAEWATPPASVSGQTDDGIDLLRALARLPVRKRMCVVLRFYADFTEAETAAAIGVSVGTVKSQTAKALRSLRESLHDSGLVAEVSTAAKEISDGA